LALTLGGTLAALNAICIASISFLIRIPSYSMNWEKGGLNGSLCKCDDKRPLLINMMML